MLKSTVCSCSVFTILYHFFFRWGQRKKTRSLWKCWLYILYCCIYTDFLLLPSFPYSSQESNPFLSSTMEADALLRSPVPPVPSKDAGRLSNSGRGLPHLPFPAELVPFDEALRDVSAGRLPNQDGVDIVARYGAQLLEVKAAERRGETLMWHRIIHYHL